MHLDLLTNDGIFISQEISATFRNCNILLLEINSKG